MSESETSFVNNKQLLAFIERVERLEEEKKAISDGIKGVFGEAKSVGFDTKTVKEIIKLRKMTADERAEKEALLDIYKAALGMLDGTPLGEAAIRRLSSKPARPATPPHSEQPEADADNEPEKQPEECLSIDDARVMGTESAQAGKPVTSNPFPARDPRRAIWDEAWCAHSGSDGMEIPSAWRRTPKKPGNGDQGAKP